MRQALVLVWRGPKVQRAAKWHQHCWMKRHYTAVIGPEELPHCALGRHLHGPVKARCVVHFCRRLQRKYRLPVCPGRSARLAS
mgnify:CR=1 FL=1